MQREALRVFEEVCDLGEPDLSEQIAARCAGRPELEALVRRMVAADRRSRPLAATGVGGDLLVADLRRDDDAPLPERIGRYRVLGELGRGGMGRVLDAEQDHPRRRVALKVIRPSLVSPRTRAWLEAEAQALGELLHPGIPQVYEAGDDDGLVFLVMEKVDGRPLNEAVKGRSVRERVTLVRRVADAVAHAHDRGLLHRDLKPANVLVTADGQPKVLDFGLATALGVRPEAVAGTPAYMAPEQRRQEPLDVRADVYALGVMLHEALRGDLPRPGRPLDAGRPDLSGDLAAIFAEATAEDRRRRYASVEAFAADLDRWFDRRPVRARRGGRAYHAVRFAQRHQGLVIASSIIALLLVVATIVSGRFAVRAERERKRAEARRVEAERARAKADAEAKRARATSAFLSDVFLKTHPHKGSGETTLLDVTKAAMARLDDGALAQAPEDEAALRLAMAEGLFSLGDVATAKGQLERIVAAWQRGDVPDGPMIIDVLHGLGEVWRAEGDPVRGDASIRRALELALAQGDRRRVPELRHSRAWALIGRGAVAEAQPLFEQALAAKRELYAEKALEPWDLANTMCGLGRALLFRGRVDEAMRAFREAHAVLAGTVGEDHLSIATVDFWLGYGAVLAGDPDAAEAWQARGAAVRDRLGLPAESPPRGHEPFDRAELLLARGDAAGAAAALAPAGTPADVEVSVRVLVAAGRAAEALALVERWPPQVTNPLHQAWLDLSRGRALLALGREEEAREPLTAGRGALVALLGPDSPWTRERPVAARLGA